MQHSFTTHLHIHSQFAYLSLRTTFLPTKKNISHAMWIRTVKKRGVSWDELELQIQSELFGKQGKQYLQLIYTNNVTNLFACGLGWSSFYSQFACLSFLRSTTFLPTKKNMYVAHELELQINSALVGKQGKQYLWLIYTNVTNLLACLWSWLM